MTLVWSDIRSAFLAKKEERNGDLYDGDECTYVNEKNAENYITCTGT